MLRCFTGNQDKNTVEEKYFCSVKLKKTFLKLFFFTPQPPTWRSPGSSVTIPQCNINGPVIENHLKRRKTR